jgi:hypothetical protein
MYHKTNIIERLKFSVRYGTDMYQKLMWKKQCRLGYWSPNCRSVFQMTSVIVVLGQI